MRMYSLTIVLASASVAFGAMHAFAAQEAEWELPDVPEVYQFDSSWPKPLPNGATLGTITGLFVDQEDHI